MPSLREAAAAPKPLASREACPGWHALARGLRRHPAATTPQWRPGPGATGRTDGSFHTTRTRNLHYRDRVLLPALQPAADKHGYTPQAPSLFLARSGHNGKDFAVRHAFFQHVTTWLTQQSRHGPLYVVGDFNARIHKIFDEEADSRCLGPYVFGQTSAHIDAQSNRSLLLELCHAHDLAVANTFMEQPACRQVTVYNVGSSPVDELTAAHFGQIDFVLVQRAWLGTVRQLYSDMNMALASHHFAVIADLQIAVPKVVKEVIPKHASNPRVCVSALTAVEVANRFALLFDESMSNHEDHELCIDDFYHVMSDAFQHDAEKCLPQRARTAKRPWISSETWFVASTATR